MNIQLFNFLEDHNAQIVNLVRDQITKERPAYMEISAGVIQSLFEQLLDGYIDLLVTGQTDALDRLYRALSRVLAAKGTKFSDVFEVPLIMEEVILRLFFTEYSDLKDEDSMKKVSKAFELIEATAHKAACRFLDIFHEFLIKRIEDYNDYLAKTQRELKVNLSSFRIEPDENL